LFSNRNFCDLAIAVSYVSFFRNSTVNVVSFARVLSSLNETRLYLVTIFCKARCSLDETRGDTLIGVLEDVLEDFSVYLRVEKAISEGVAENYCYTVRRFLKWVDTINPERKDAIKYYDALLKERKKASTIQNILAALKRFYEFNGKELDLKAPRKNVKQIDYLTVTEAKTLLYKIDNYRDYAMVLVMLYGGLRVGEVCNLDREDVDFEEFTLTVRNTKNRRDRTVFVTEKCIKAIEAYLETRMDTDKPLFVSRKKGRISRNQIFNLVKKYAVMADLRVYTENGVMKTKVSPHTLRHTAATNLIVNDCDVVVVQQHLGHTDIQSTMKYVHVAKGMYGELYRKHVPKY
jgi:integrase/recombinase XerD